MNLGYLFYLDLGYNQLGGRIPVDWVDGINAMSSLRILYMNNNQFTGYLPQYFPSIGNGRLETFAINDNQFTGSFEFLTNYTERDFMAVLEINNNQFTAISEDVCNLSIFAGGQMTSFQADCEICSCASLCSTDYCVI